MNKTNYDRFGDREHHQAEIERGIQIVVTPLLRRSEAWTRVQLAAQIDGCTVAQLAADGIMAAVEAREDDREEFIALN